MKKVTHDYWFVLAARLPDGKDIVVYRVNMFGATGVERSNEGHFYGYKSFRNLSVGTIYKVQASGEGDGLTLHGVKAAKWIATWPDEVERAEWRQQDEGIAAELHVRKMSKQDPLVELMEPIAAIYKQQRGIGRKMTLAKIIQILERYDR